VKIRIIDRRHADTGLKNNKATGKPIASIPDSFAQRIINFIKKLSITPIEINKVYDPKNEQELIQYINRYLTNKFIDANLNLKDKFGLIKYIIDRYFNYELVKDKIEIKPVTTKQLELNFEQFYKRIFEKYRN